KGKYSLDYTIKLNPEHKFIKAIYDYHQPNQVILDYEVGTKSEFLAVLSTEAKTQKIICNGFKDHSFYKIEQIAAKIGNKIIIVIVNISEIN
ncbi:arginine decarboxylase, partial [Francisella tularensis subsp. holarctica]|nr:arginine decarboxylase [Francisella tularensis subsp. holarctica]